MYSSGAPCSRMGVYFVLVTPLSCSLHCICELSQGKQSVEEQGEVTERHCDSLFVMLNAQTQLRWFQAPILRCVLGLHAWDMSLSKEEREREREREEWGVRGRKTCYNNRTLRFLRNRLLKCFPFSWRVELWFILSTSSHSEDTLLHDTHSHIPRTLC